MSVADIQYIHPTFFLIRTDLLELGDRFCPKHAYAFGTALRALEWLRTGRIKALQHNGKEMTEIDEEDLWFHASAETLATCIAGPYKERTMRTLLPKLIAAGFARQRYLVEGRYYATYREAMKAAKGDTKKIASMMHLEVGIVNEAIAQLSPTSPDSPQKQNGDAQHVANERPPQETEQGGVPTADSSSATIPHHRHFCQWIAACTQAFKEALGKNADGETRSEAIGKSANVTLNADPIGKNAMTPSAKMPETIGKNAGNNKDLNKKESLLKEDLISAGGAVDLSLFDFSQSWGPQPLTELVQLILPPLKQSYRQPGAHEQRVKWCEDAILTLAQDPYFQERGLRHFARWLCYASQRNSGCRWLSWQSPRAPVRIWSLAKDDVARLISQEMERKDWWPEGLAPVWREEPPNRDIDLATLASIPEDARTGMSKDEAQKWLARLEVWRKYGYDLRAWPVGPAALRGYSIEVIWLDNDARRFLRFYEPWQWGIIEDAATEADGGFGSPEFVAYLVTAIKQQQKIAQVA